MSKLDDRIVIFELSLQLKLLNNKHVHNKHCIHVYATVKKYRVYKIF